MDEHVLQDVDRITDLVERRRLARAKRGREPESRDLGDDLVLDVRASGSLRAIPLADQIVESKERLPDRPSQRFRRMGGQDDRRPQVADPIRETVHRETGAFRPHEEALERVLFARSAQLRVVPLLGEIPQPEEEREAARDFPDLRRGHVVQLADQLPLVGTRITFAKALRERTDVVDLLREGGAVLLRDDAGMRLTKEGDQLAMTLLGCVLSRHAVSIPCRRRDQPSTGALASITLRNASGGSIVTSISR